MRNNILIRLLVATALLILAIPVVASAQYYNRDRYDRADTTDRLESDLSFARGRRVLGGLLWVGEDNSASVAEVRDFRRAVRELRYASDGGRDLRGSYDEARMVLDRGVQLDRDLRLRTGRESVDADLSDIRSSLHIIADAYNLRMPY